MGSRHPVTVHMDTNGPMRTKGTFGGNSIPNFPYIIMDDVSSWRWCFVLKNKNQVYKTVRNLVQRLDRSGNLTVRIISSDGGTEFVISELEDF